MRFPTFQKLAVALSIATFGVVAPFAHTMAQTNAQPQKLTGSAALFAEGQSTEAKQADAYFDNYPFRSGEVIEKLRLHFAAYSLAKCKASKGISSRCSLNGGETIETTFSR